MEQNREVRLEERSTDQRPLRDVVELVIEDVRDIIRAEARLAGVELKQKARKSVKPGVLLGGAGILGFFAMACFTTTCIVALDIVLPLWLSALLIGVMLAAAAGGAFVLGRLALEEIDPVPQETLETLKDNIEWVRNRTR